ncbi:putative membrane channel-forming protein YqfA (hemolysin III family) [Bacillus sp. OAE603]
MKTHSILFVVIFLIHTINLVNVTLFDGEWNGIVLMLSNILFLIGVIYYGIEFRANRNRKG